MDALPIDDPTMMPSVEEQGRRDGDDDDFDGYASPYLTFGADEWARFRADTPMTLSEEEVRRLRSFNDPVEIDEVTRIYLALSRLIASHVEATRVLHEQRSTFLNRNGRRTPFVIGIAGSVAVGKSTTARVLRELMGHWKGPDGRTPRVELITTDGFLLPNAVLREQGLMERKGFPESFDRKAILRFLSAIKAGEANVAAPVYDHLAYDIVEDREVVVDRPDILVFEGINVLQVHDLPRGGRTVPFVSDFFDFSIYIDADEATIRRWYLARFRRLRETAFRRPESFFSRYAEIPEEEALAIAERLWDTINGVNLRENILPTRPRADVVLHKGERHGVERVSLRKL